MDEATLMRAIAGKVEIIPPGDFKSAALKLTPREHILFEEAKANHFVVRKGRINVSNAYRIWCSIHEEIYAHITPRGKTADVWVDLAYARRRLNPEMEPEIKRILEPYRKRGSTLGCGRHDIGGTKFPIEVAEPMVKKLYALASANSYRERVARKIIRQSTEQVK